MSDLPAALAADLKEQYHLTPDTVHPVSGGWLNEKWKITAGGGAYLVKKFSRERFSERQLTHIRTALTVQCCFSEEGFPCPRLLAPDGMPLRMMPDGTVYAVMEFAPGRVVTPEEITAGQMRSLGEVCARMKERFAHMDGRGMRGYPLSGEAILTGLHVHLRREREKADAPPALCAGLDDAARILPRLTPAMLDDLPRGVAHEDFTPDNMLFDDRGVTAVLDFDRTQYGFVCHDIGRALMSLAWQDGRMDPALLSAFRQGYERHRPLPPEAVADALRVTWYVEFPWWISASAFRETSPKVCRFRKEILWIGQNWDALDTKMRGGTF